MKEDEINLARRHRHGEAWDGAPRMPAERKYPLWPVVLGLVVFWIVVILAVRGCA